MTEKLKQTIKEEVGKLPKETQEAINTLDWPKLTEEIGKKHLLNENEINDLQVETLLALVGITELYSYESNIENNVGTSKEEATKISEEVLEKIFIPIKNIVEENIRETLKSKNIDPRQNVNFILSGGSYSIFLERKTNEENVDKTSVPIGTSSIQSIKNKLIN